MIEMPWVDIGYFVLSVGCLAYMGWRVFKLHMAIDTESIAELEHVIKLEKHSYALRYKVHASEPFELLLSPRKKAKKIGSKSVIYYEKANPKNHYFKSIGTYDKRFNGIVIVAIVTVLTFINIFL